MKIAIVGLGVIGGSFAMALTEAGYREIYGIDKNEETLRKAKAMGIIKEGGTDGTAFLKEADLILIALYPNLVKQFIMQNRGNLRPGAVLTDVTGIKGILIEDVIKALPDGVDFVFGHPMAGREKKGIDFASSKVFKGANYLIAPISRNTEEHLQMVEALARDAGFGRIRRVSPELHDEMIGFTSQLPHAMAVALINSDKEGRDTGSFIGDSYRDLTRIANINESLWSELFLGNRENLLSSIEHFEQELDKIKDALRAGDEKTLQELFIKSSRRREALN